MLPVRGQRARAVHHRAPLPRIHILQVHKQLVVFQLGDGHPVPVVDPRGRGTLRERVVAGVGEVMAVSIPSAAVRKGFGNGVVSVHDPHSGGVGHGWHARLLPLLLVSVDNEQGQEEEDDQDEDDDAGDGPDLVGVSGESRAGSA